MLFLRLLFPASGVLSPVLGVLLEGFRLRPVGLTFPVLFVVGMFAGFAEFMAILPVAGIPLLMALRGILTVTIPVVALLGIALFLLMLLGLLRTFLLGPLVEGGSEFLEGGDEVGAEVTLGFVGLLDGFGHLLDRSGKALDGGVDGLEAGGTAPE